MQESTLNVKAEVLNLRTIVEDGEAGNDRAPICCVIDTEFVGWKLIMEQWRVGV